ncbi:MAG: ComEC/Rec2 family competence protein [Marinifilaceae bacterium]
MKKTSVPMIPVLCSYIAGIISTSFYLLPMWIGALCCIIGLCYATMAKKARDMGIILFFIVIGNLLCQTDKTPSTYSQVPKWTVNLREKCNNKIDNLFPSSTHSAIVKALLLGDKRAMSKDNKFIFTESGTIHLMAVSGLHVGAIFILSLFLLNKLKLSRRSGMLLSLICVWSYALLSGLAPSTVRAATLLSFVTIAYAAQIIYNPINLCAATAFIALLLAPRLLYSLSFQLSYLAYTGIILILPLVGQFSTFKKQWQRYLVMSISISVITQLCTAPLLLYHFNHLPLNGIIVNLLAIPLATIILYSIIIVMLLPTALAIWPAMLCKHIINLLLWLLKPFAEHSFAYTSTTSFLPWEITIFFLLIATTLLFWKTQHKIYYYCSFLLLLPCSYLLFSHRTTPQGANIICFNPGYTPSILIQKGKQCYLINSDTYQSNQVVTYINNKRLQLLEFNNPIWHNADIAWIHADTSVYNGQPIMICNTNIDPQSIIFQKHNNTLQYVILTQTSNNVYIKKWQNFLSQKQINNIYVENNQIKRLKQSEIFR